MVGDTRTAALVSRDGSIDWLCWPRYDADPLFGRLLDAPGGGHFRFWVKGGRAAARAYHERSPVLETSINAPGGKARLVDAMPFRRRQGPNVVRPHDPAARGVRWRPQLGLPLGLAARCQRRRGGNDRRRPHRRSRIVPGLARPPRLRSARAAAHVPG